LVAAEELGKLVDLVGGPSFAHVLLNPLETLAGVEEANVRDKVVDSVSTITKRLPTDSVVRHVVPMLKRLANGDWFTSRVSASGLFTVTYPRADASVRGALRRSVRILLALRVAFTIPLQRR
jgi:serine/threonine-protein phosphatase 2A regulatory subunit A